MIVDDIIYGKVDIDEPVLCELINSKPLQRLKLINQAGASKYVLSDKTMTRFEHTVGVMILLKKLNASLPEQIAGLLHDVPHTAFSHVIDFVFESENHDYHEEHHERIVMNSEIPSILKKYGLDIKLILDDRNFPLLERKLPDLCADRIDYMLKDMKTQMRKGKEAKEYVKHLIVVDNEIILDSMECSKDIASDFLWLDESVYASPIEVAAFKILADAIRIALKENIVTEDDLFKDDDYVYDILKKSKNKDITAKLDLLTPKLKVRIDKKEYDYYAKPKVRYIDPKFRGKDGKIRRLSEVYPKILDKIEKHKREAKEMHIKIV
jgi:HD superfamily phosphohydrolase